MREDHAGHRGFIIILYRRLLVKDQLKEFPAVAGLQVEEYEHNGGASDAGTAVDIARKLVE